LIVVWLKLLHVTALSIWAGGILLMPVLLGQREAAGEGNALHRLHAFSRFAYITVISPAAFVAIGSGIALIFAREVFTAWFAVKLLFVGILVALHVWTGLLVLSVFNEGQRFAPWRVGLSLGVLSLVMGAIFYVVLDKPEIALDGLPAALTEPGGLQALAVRFIPGLTP
jgi:protoporphyrinogen IX oxidase